MRPANGWASRRTPTSWRWSAGPASASRASSTRSPAPRSAEASVLRPTTGEAVAWIGRDTDALVAPILDRLGVGDRRVHDDPAFERVVLLDLPDVDSVASAHRARVEELLPKVDAVAWVTDPEKYADALLHDEFFAAWLPAPRSPGRAAQQGRPPVAHRRAQAAGRSRATAGAAEPWWPYTRPADVRGRSGRDRRAPGLAR